MLHRSKVREFVVQCLKQNEKVVSLVGLNIQDSKVTPFVADGLPGINVVTPTQNGTSRSINVVSFTNTLKLNVEIYVSSMDGWQKKADEIAEAVENALLNNQGFLGLFTEISTYDVENSMYDQGAQPIVVQILSFNISFFEDYKGNASDYLNETHVNVDVIDPIAKPAPGPDGRIEFQLNVKTGEENESKTESE